MHIHVLQKQRGFFPAGITVPRVISYRLTPFSSRNFAPFKCSGVQGQHCVFGDFSLLKFFVHIFFTFQLLIALLFLVEVWGDSSVHADVQ